MRLLVNQRQVGIPPITPHRHESTPELRELESNPRAEGEVDRECPPVDHSEPAPFTSWVGASTRSERRAEQAARASGSVARELGSPGNSFADAAKRVATN